jgi:hypothetical protein
MLAEGGPVLNVRVMARFGWRVLVSITTKDTRSLAKVAAGRASGLRLSAFGGQESFAAPAARFGAASWSSWRFPASR